ncbi:MAG: Flp family type IVb pilin [Dehalococcoidia bacterium]
MLSKINEALLTVLAHFRNEKGQALAEYGLILALIAVVTVAALVVIGTQLNVTFGDIGGCLTDPTSC